MKKNVLGKGLSSLIPLEEVSEKQKVDNNEKILPESGSVEDYSEDNKISIDNVNSHEIIDKEEIDEKRVFFNAKTGRYEEVRLGKQFYDTKEMPVISGRRSNIKGCDVSSNERDNLPYSKELKKDKKNQNKYYAPKTSFLKEPNRRDDLEESIKVLVRKEVDIRLKSLVGVIQGEVERMRYLEKKINNIKENSGVNQEEIDKVVGNLKIENDHFLKEAKNHIDNIIKNLKNDFENLKKSYSKSDNNNDEILKKITLNLKDKIKEEIRKESFEQRKMAAELARRIAVKDNQLNEIKRDLDMIKNMIKNEGAK